MVEGSTLSYSRMPINKCTRNDGVNGGVRNHLLIIIVISDLGKLQWRTFYKINGLTFSKNIKVLEEKGL